MVKRLKINIHGVVQGVSFRYYTVREARRLKICGWVRNREDGSVQVEAEAEEPALTAFLEWCRVGPRWAKVSRVEYEYSKTLKNYASFDIR